jgi:hypothetical protein
VRGLFPQDRAKRVAHSLLLRLVQAKPHRQPHQPLRQRGRQRQIAVRAPEAQACRRGVQRHVVKHPRSTKAFAVDTKVKDGMITSSPLFRSSSSAAMSSAEVHEWVSSALAQPVRCSIHWWQRLVKAPSPDKCKFPSASPW